MGGYSSSPQQGNVKNQMSTHPVLMYSIAGCTYCVRAKNIFNTLKVTPHIISVDTDPNADDIARALVEITKQDTFPFRIIIS